MSAIVMQRAALKIRIEPTQISVIQAPLDELIGQVEADNGLPEFPNFRERVLGQIKAGREMLLSGCVWAQLLYWVLLRALGELVEKYGKKAIGVAAARLIELLVEQIFKGSADPEPFECHSASFLAHRRN